MRASTGWMKDIRVRRSRFARAPPQRGRDKEPQSIRRTTTWDFTLDNVHVKRWKYPDMDVALLDVGVAAYGDSILCRFEDATVMIDGAHPGHRTHRRPPLDPGAARQLLGVDRRSNSISSSSRTRTWITSAVSPTW
jgi:hypothetical protein